MAIISVAAGQDIQAAIDGANPGDTVELGVGEHVVGGTFGNENGAIEINPTTGHVNLVGAGATPGDVILNMTGVGGNTRGLWISADGTSAADPVKIHNMTVKGDYYGLTIGRAKDTLKYVELKDLIIQEGNSPNLSFGARDNTVPKDDTYIISDVNIENVVINSASTWAIMIWDTLQNLRVRNLELNYVGTGLGFGWHHEAQSWYGWITTGESTNWDVRGVTVDGFAKKGIYLENVDNAYFKDITVTNCGTDTGATWGGTGFELNLKRGDYQNIFIENLNVTGCGTANANSMAVAFRGRDKMTDPLASYGLNPGYVGSIGVLGGKIDGGNIGLCLGEYTAGVLEGDSVAGSPLINNMNLIDPGLGLISLIGIKYMTGPGIPSGTRVISTPGIVCGDLASGNTTVSIGNFYLDHAPNQVLAPGMLVGHASIPAGTTLVSVDYDAMTMELSAAPTASVNNQYIQIATVLDQFELDKNATATATGETFEVQGPAFNMSPMRVDVRDFVIENCVRDGIKDARGNRDGFIYNNRYLIV